jgi:hypothetical protein
MLRENFAQAGKTPFEVGRPVTGEDRNLPVTIEQFHRLLTQDPPGREIVDSIEREAFRVRCVGVPRDDRDAGIDRTIDRLGQEVGVQRRDPDPVDALCDVRLEDLLLSELVRRWGPVPEDLDVSELRRRALRANSRVIEHRKVERFRNDREAELPGCSTAAARRFGFAAPDRAEETPHDHGCNDAVHGFNPQSLIPDHESPILDSLIHESLIPNRRPRAASRGPTAFASTTVDPPRR